MDLKNIKIEIVNVNENVEDIVKSGILLDDEATCYHGFKSLFEIVWSIISTCIIYNVTLDNKQIGLILLSNYEEIDDELEISTCLKKEYRKLGIGSYLIRKVLEDCELNGVSKIHALVRCDNAASNRLFNSLNFIKYEDDVDDFVLNNKRVKQLHYVYDVKK